jgi:hypothetical protein
MDLIYSRTRTYCTYTKYKETKNVSLTGAKINGQRKNSMSFLYIIIKYVRDL